MILLFCVIFGRSSRIKGRRVMTEGGGEEGEEQADVTSYHFDNDINEANSTLVSRLESGFVTST